MVKILVFGIFDGVHPGHIDFFHQAKKRGDFLIVAVGRAEASQKFKNKLPGHSLSKRIKDVENVEYVDKAVPGDREQGEYKIVLREKPDIICTGYDQKELARDLTQWLKSQNLKTPIKVLKPHKSNQYHSSILNGSPR